MPHPQPTGRYFQSTGAKTRMALAGLVVLVVCTGAHILSLDSKVVAGAFASHARSHSLFLRPRPWVSRGRVRCRGAGGLFSLHTPPRLLRVWIVLSLSLSLSPSFSTLCILTLCLISDCHGIDDQEDGRVLEPVSRDVREALAELQSDIAARHPPLHARQILGRFAPLLPVGSLALYGSSPPHM